jgi:hypothetical protein
VGNLMERAQLEDLDIDGRRMMMIIIIIIIIIIANWIFKKCDGEA